jgi:hypothetical protein
MGQNKKIMKQLTKQQRRTYWSVLIGTLTFLSFFAYYLYRIGTESEELPKDIVALQVFGTAVYCVLLC